MAFQTLCDPVRHDVGRTTGQVASQHDYSMRELFNALIYFICSGIAWRAMPNDFPPRTSVYQQMQRWMAAKCFDTMAQGSRLSRLVSGSKKEIRLQSPQVECCARTLKPAHLPLMTMPVTNAHRKCTWLVPHQESGCVKLGVASCRFPKARWWYDPLRGQERLTTTKDYERRAERLAGFQPVGFIPCMRKHAAALVQGAGNPLA